jgi:hypothetical protein
MNLVKPFALALGCFPAFISAGLAAQLSDPTRGPDSTPAQIMIVGVAHLVARNDIHTSQFTDNPLSPKRQAEIADIVRRLARFEPTKVLVEADMDDPVYARRYDNYVRNNYTLPANEVYQFGFRLAKVSGNSTIFPIDTDGPQLIDDATPVGKSIEAFLKANFNNVDDPITDASMNRDDAIERRGTYLDVLRFLNTDEAIRANASWYSVFDGTGRSADNAGAAYVSQWYARNCYIFSNILSVITPGDRVVVLIGAGHTYLLREFARLNPHLVDVDPLKYLSN